MIDRQRLIEIFLGQVRAGEQEVGALVLGPGFQHLHERSNRGVRISLPEIQLRHHREGGIVVGSDLERLVKHVFRLGGLPVLEVGDRQTVFELGYMSVDPVEMLEFGHGSGRIPLDQPQSAPLEQGLIVAVVPIDDLVDDRRAVVVPALLEGEFHREYPPRNVIRRLGGQVVQHFFRLGHRPGLHLEIGIPQPTGRTQRREVGGAFQGLIGLQRLMAPPIDFAQLRVGIA